jgi:predicted nucleic acid-binding protein
MAAVFFDTSALIRRYDRAESGAARVAALCHAASGHVLFIAQLTSIEVASALNRKLREGTLGHAERDRLWRLFRRHRREQYHVTAIDVAMFAVAEDLLFAHPLRAYDAVQLATALATRRLLGDLAGEFKFCTADRLQARAAAGAQLDVEFIA